MVSDLNIIVWKLSKIAAKKSVFLLILAYKTVLLSASVERCFVSRMWGFVIIYAERPGRMDMEKSPGYILISGYIIISIIHISYIQMINWQAPSCIYPSLIAIFSYLQISVINVGGNYNWIKICDVQIKTLGIPTAV